MDSNKAITYKEKLLTPDFILILLLAIINSTIVHSFTTILPLFTKKLGANNVIAGLMVTVFMVAAIIVRPFWGYLSDIKSRRMVVIIGAVLVALSLSGYSFAKTVTVLLVLRFIQGLGFSANTNTTATMAADIIPPSRLSEGIGYYGMSSVLATAIGPPVAVFVMEDFGFDAFFKICSVVGVICIVIASLVRYEKKLPARKPDEGKKKLVLYEKGSVHVSFVLLFVALGVGSIAGFIPLLSIDRGIANYKLYFLVYAAALTLTRVTIGKVSDRKGPEVVIVPGIICIFLAFIAFAAANSLPILLVGGVLFGFGFGTVQPMLNVLVIQRCPKDRRGAANSTFYNAMDLGVALGAAIAGVISQYFGYTVLYIFCEIYALMAFIIFFTLVKKNNMRRRKEST